MHEKCNPFHGRFTHKTTRFWLEEIIELWNNVNSCFPFIQNSKIPLKLSTFSRETISYFLDFSVTLKIKERGVLKVPNLLKVTNDQEIDKLHQRALLIQAL